MYKRISDKSIWTRDDYMKYGRKCNELLHKVEGAHSVVPWLAKKSIKLQDENIPVCIHGEMILHMEYDQIKFLLYNTLKDSVCIIGAETHLVNRCFENSDNVTLMDPDISRLKMARIGLKCNGQVSRVVDQLCSYKPMDILQMVFIRHPTMTLQEIMNYMKHIHPNIMKYGRVCICLNNDATDKFYNTCRGYGYELDVVYYYIYDFKRYFNVISEQPPIPSGRFIMFIRM